jgi:MFS family permease
LPRPRPRSPDRILPALTFASFIFAFQAFMVLPALPAIGHDFNTSAAWATWIFTGFLISSAIAAPLLGKVGDERGRRRMMLVALAIFFVGSLGSVLAPTIGVLIATRIVQGVGNVAVPLGYSIVKDEFPAGRLSHAVAVLTLGLPIGTAVGLLVGGFADLVSWRLLFGIAAGLVAVAFLLVRRFVPESPARPTSRPDVRGALLLSGGLVAFLLGVTQGSSWGWGSPRVLGLLAAALVLLPAWVLVELRTSEPMVDIRMLGRRPVLLTNVASAIGMGFVINGALILIPRLLAAPRGVPEQYVDQVDYGFGASTTLVGLYMLAWAAAGLPAARISVRVTRRFGGKAAMTGGMLLISGGLGLFFWFHEQWWQVVPALALIGFGFPFAAAASATLIISMVRQDEAGVAMGMTTVIRQMVGAPGGQIVAAILTGVTIAGTPVASEEAYEIAFAMLAIAGLLAAAISFLISPRRARVAANTVVVPTRGGGG